MYEVFHFVPHTPDLKITKWRTHAARLQQYQTVQQHSRTF